MNHPVAAIPRRDPRRPWVSGPGGIKRIVLGEERGSRDAQQPGHGPSGKPLRSAGPFGQRILVVGHAERGQPDEALIEALAAAAVLAGPDTEVLAALIGLDDAVSLAELGVDRVLALPDPGYAPQALLAWLDAVWKQERPTQALFPDRGDDADLGRRFACRQGLPAVTDVLEIAADGVRRRLSSADFALHDSAPVLLLARGVADARLPFVGLGLRGDSPVSVNAAERVRDLGSQSSPASALPLEEADLILSAGNGVADVPSFLELARTMGAAVGASRVAVDDGRFTRDKQVGATGKTVQASAYIALGISGAVQHLQGIKSCRHVIAVNLDAAAPIVKRADLTIVEDCAAFIAALQALVAAARQEKQS